jgi:hypothetical protein
MATRYVSSALLEAQSGGRAFFSACFWIWGVLGLIGNTINFLSATGSVGVGTSAYITMCLLYWIGGMLLFGLGGLLMASSYDFKRPEAEQA